MMYGSVVDRDVMQMVGVRCHKPESREFEPNPSSSTVTLESTQPLTEVSNGVKDSREVKLTTSWPHVNRLPRNYGSPKVLRTIMGFHGLLQELIKLIYVMDLYE
jgi:hypothetical protein